MHSGLLEVPQHPVARSVRSSSAHGITLCLLAAVGYYAGVKLGFALTFAPSPVSVLWPPNAVLMATLLLAPQRTWLLILAAILPVHVAAQLHAGVPLVMVLAWFGTNALEALIGALGLRALLGRVPSFDCVSDSAAFLLVAVVCAAVATSFADAAVVTMLGWGSVGYWDLWRTRLCSNALATLVVVPVIVSWIAGYRDALRGLREGRLAEAVLLALGLGAASLLAFDALPATSKLQIALLYAPLPFLLWAALRFGPAGSSTAFMLVAIVVIWGASQGRGPFVAGASAQNVFSIQIFLVFVGATLVMLAAAVEERARSLVRLEKMQQSLHAGDERFRLVLSATSDVIYDWNLETGKLWWNPNGNAYFSTLSNAAVKDGWWTELLHSEDKPFGARLHALTRGTESICEAECRLRRIDRSHAHVFWQAFVVRDDEGRALRMIGSIMDITERKRVEEAQRQLAHVSRLAVMGELTASVAHEINQPLGAILTNADAAEILLEQADVPVEELRRIVDDIRADDMRAAAVIRHMRQLLTKRELSMQPFDLKRAIEDVLRLVSADLTRLQATVECDLVRLPPVYGDPTQLQHVILNLILNACDAMAETPAAARRLGVRTARVPGDKVEVTVWDCGPGVAPEQAERLFESFFTTKAGGMGLGLSIARTIVAAHGGRIRGGTRPEGGAAFVFSLPLDPAAHVRAVT